MEEWKPIHFYKGKYEVSSFGRIRSLDRVEEYNRFGRIVKRNKKGKILKPRERDGGYVAVMLGFRKKDSPVHHLVANAFVGRRPKGFQINHKDGNKKNNRKENLEWVTAKQNRIHAIETGLNRTNKGQKWTQLKIDDITKIRESSQSVSELSKLFDVDPATIRRIIKNITFTNI